MIKEFTASVYIIADDKVLLIFHPKMGKWLPPGGHVEANESPADAVKREALEETGFEIELIKQENVWVSEWNAKSFERPYLCLTEEIPPYKSMPAHQHMDFVYVARPLIQTNLMPELRCQWFGANELNLLHPEVDIFSETFQIIQHLLQTFKLDHKKSSFYP